MDATHGRCGAGFWAGLLVVVVRTRALSNWVISDLCGHGWVFENGFVVLGIGDRLWAEALIGTDLVFWDAVGILGWIGGAVVMGERADRGRGNGRLVVVRI
ncbi:hypothetical protein M0R45_036250 [Rubus argutus]|uniref:NADH dehydrogenase subunit 6 n=1 Tax=Rubus argutus TaxID=59490 RepID=A0AAW1W0I8_RUBAR